jgi:hypothetical protein
LRLPIVWGKYSIRNMPAAGDDLSKRSGVF